MGGILRGINMRYLLGAVGVVTVVVLGFIQTSASNFTGSGTFVVGATSGTCATSISDDFSGDLTLWSEHGTSGLWTITSGEAVVTDKSVLLYTDEQTCTITQWVMYKFTPSVSTTYSGAYLRSENDETTYAYAVRYEDTANQFAWRFCGGDNNSDQASACQTLKTWSNDLTINDYVGIDIAGTGDATTVTIYDLGTTAKDHANWASSNDASQALTASPTYPADAGKYVGLYSGYTSDGGFDDFTAE